MNVLYVNTVSNSEEQVHQKEHIQPPSCAHMKQQENSGPNLGVSRVVCVSKRLGMLSLQVPKQTQNENNKTSKLLPISALQCFNLKG